MQTVLELTPRQLSPDTIERLLKVHEVLRNVPDDRVDLHGWVGDPDERGQSSCGTTACAVGWACTAPWFNERGLHLDDGKPAFDCAFSWIAVERFFDLTEDEATALFYAPLDYSREGGLDRAVYAPGEPKGDKARVFWRIRTLLLRFGAISDTVAARLAAEATPA